MLHDRLDPRAARIPRQDRADRRGQHERRFPRHARRLCGYLKERAADVAQFTLSDSRTPDEVYAAIRANGQEVVFKNWDNRI